MNTNNPSLVTAARALEIPEDGDGKGTDAPFAGSGVVRRENVDLTNTILPAAIFGAQELELEMLCLLVFQLFIFKTLLVLDLSREDILELGRKALTIVRLISQ